MTNPFGGVGGSTDVGTASGKVRIEYESVGAPSVLNQVQQVHQAVERTAASMDALNRRNKDTIAETLLGGSHGTTSGSGYGTTGGGISQHVSQITRAIEEVRRSRDGLTFDSIPIRFDTSSLREQAAHARRIVQQEFSRNAIDFKINVSETSRGGGGSQGGGLGFIFDILSGRGGSAMSMLRSTGMGMGQSLGSGIAGGIASVGAGAAIGGITLAATGAAAAVGALGYVVTKGFERQENIDSAATKMRALGYNTTQVQSIMKSALDSVNQTAFSLDEAAQTAVQALAAGVKGGDTLTNYLKDVANTAALAKMSMADMGYYFNQVATQGHLEGNQLQELQQRGVPILQYLADEYGVTQQKASEMVSAGQVDFAHFEEAVHKHVSGIADTMGGSISGAIDNLKTSIARLGAAFLAPIFGGQDGQMSNFAKGIESVQRSIDNLAKNLAQHQKGLIDFWADFGEGALMSAHIIVDAIDIIMHIVGDAAKFVGNMSGAFAELFDLVGDHGIAKSMRQFGDSANNFGDSTNRAGNKVYDFNHKIDDGWRSLNNWRNHAKDAAGATNNLAGAFADVPPKAISITDALDKLNIKSDSASKQFSGNIQQFHELLDAMVKANASKDLIDTVTKLHQEYNDSGRAAAEYGEALDKLGDSSATADDKAKSLLKALQDMNSLPSGDKLKDFNDAVRQATDYQSKLVDHLDLTGGQLIETDGTINSASKNGSTLATTIENIREKMYALAASGEKKPEEVWNASNRAITALLGNFGIFGTQAQNIIDKYLKPEKEFEIIFNAKNEPEVQRELTQLLTQIDDAKAKGSNQVEFKLGVDEATAPNLQRVLEQLGVQWNQYDPLSKTATVTVPPESREKVAQALKGIFANDPAQVPSSLDIKTTQHDILQKITGLDGVLHIPTVLDIPAAGQPGGPPPGTNTAAPPGNPPPQPGPTPPAGQPPLTQILPQQQSPPKPSIQDVPPWVAGLPGFPGVTQPVTPNSLLDPGKHIPSAADIAATNPQTFTDLLAAHPDIGFGLQSAIQDANKSGKSLSQAFAEGIDSNNPAVRDAIIKLAELAGDGLGRSPAKYGPLSGTGWTFYRGQAFTTAWSQGIASQTKSVAGASTSVAQASIMPLDDQITGFVKDMQALTKLGSGLEGLVSQVANIGLGFGGLFNKLSDGRLFPKSYKIDPSFDFRRNALGPGGAFGPDSGGSGSTPPGYGPTRGGQAGGAAGAPAALGPQAGQQDIANYIIQKAMSQGYSREQANNFVVQAFGESHLSPTASNPAGWEGIFQFDQPTWASAGGGDIHNAQQNIDNYFRLAQIRGLTPQSFTSPSQLGTQVSIGGPLHPRNAQDLPGAISGAQRFIAGFKPTGAMPGVGGANPGAAVPLPPGNVNAGLPGANTNYNPAWMVAHGFPALFQKTGPGGDATQGDIPPWMHAIADQFGLTISSHPDTTLHGNAATGSWAVDIGGPGADPAKMEALAKFLEQNYAGDIAQLIHRSGTTDYGIAGGQNVGGARGTGTYYTTGEGYSQHTDHVHVAFARPLGLGGAGGDRLPWPGFQPRAGTPAPPTAPPTPPSAPTGPARWMPITGKDGKQWYFAQTPSGDRWLPPGIDPATIEFTADGSPKTPNGQMWSNSGILVPVGGSFSGSAPDRPGTFTPQPLPGKTPPTPPAAPTAPLTQQSGDTTPPTPSPGATQPDSGGFAIPGATDGVLGDLVAQDPLLAAAIQASQGVGGGNDPKQVVPLLQHLDSLIEDQNKIVTAAEGRNKLAGGFTPPDPAAVQAKELSTALSGIKSGLTQQYGLQEGQTGLEQAQTMISGASGIASDIFQTLDAGLQAMGATQNALDIVSRGIANTKDVSKLVDDFQTYITLASKIFQTAGDITSFAGSFSGGADFGGTAAAGQALSMIGQALAAINTGIDLAQETYQVTMKYVGRFLTSWLGFPGAQDMNFLLDEKTGQLQAYTSANPDQKSTFNTLGRMANQGNYVDQRVQPTNQFVIYQGPGQDPRDTMNDAMFAVRSSGIGAFGYDSARPA